MEWVAITCPQCGAPLPRVALWRAVKCSACGSLVTRSEPMVHRDSFRKALARTRQETGFAGGLECGGDRYHLLQSLGHGEISEVYLARRLGALPLLATIKLSSAPTGASRYAREAEVLRELRSADGAAGGFFAMHLPQVVALGVAAGNGAQQALVLLHPNGFWGSLAALNERFPDGLDPRHGVWIWRRMLAALGMAHSLGWCHGDVRPEHALVHPEDHGVRLIGWAAARKGAGAQDQARDLQRSGRVVQVLLNGDGETAPSRGAGELGELVARAGEDEDFYRAQRAEGLDASLRAAANAAFGPPAFVPLEL